MQDVLVIGAGIAGCAVALALAKRGISVTVITSSRDLRAYHSSFMPMEEFENRVSSVQFHAERYLGCRRATEQLTTLAKRSLEDLLASHPLIDRNGHLDIHRSLQEQLKHSSMVEWISQCSAIDLISLEQHSMKRADRYKKPTCLGAYVYNHETGQIETFLAKETVLATGGASSLFPYSTHHKGIIGEGLAMANRIGARLLHLEEIDFYPLTLFEKNKPCFPLPLELLKEGGKVWINKNAWIETPEEDVARFFYQELLKDESQHLWLDLTSLDPVALRERFPSFDAYCLNHGFNIAKDPLPVMPAAQHTSGGVAVDRFGQTTVQRLRAIGEVACTGLYYDRKDEALRVLESLTWANACAENMTKQMEKFIYYFPELKKWNSSFSSPTCSMLQEDWNLLRQVMWNYLGIIRDTPDRLKKGRRLLNLLNIQLEQQTKQICSIEHMHLFNGIQVACLIAESAMKGTPLLNNS